MIKQLLPPSIAIDENISKLAQSGEDIFSFLLSQTDNTLIYSAIDRLQEEVLDLLAWQFHIEGYELVGSLEEKRAMIKNAIEIHRHKGTKWAIKKVLEILHMDGEIQEWFDYNGEAYKFKVLVKSIIQDEDTYKKLAELINEYKNVRSLLDVIGFHREYTNNIYYAFAQKNGKNYKIGLHVDTTVENNDYYIGITQRYGASYQIGVYKPQVSMDNNNLYFGITQRIASYTAIYPASGG